MFTFQSLNDVYYTQTIQQTSIGNQTPNKKYANAKLLNCFTEKQQKQKNYRSSNYGKLH